MTAENIFALQSHLDFLRANQPRRLSFRAQSLSEFGRWRDELRSEIVRHLGIAGRAPIPVSVKIIATTDRGDYIEDKLALAVSENVQTPIYTLTPKHEPPFKPILVFHGHDPSAQFVLGNFPNDTIACEQLATDNNYAQALVQAGYLVCVFEQRGLGERTANQISNETPPRSCRHLAFEYLLQGRALIGERCWDGVCAINYLNTRTDIVHGVLGCTGHSGGGTTTLWLSALDSRITTIVVSGYFCSFEHSILAMAHCECNYVPGILSLAEMGDLAALFAPRPFRAINGEADPIFPTHAAREQFETVQRAYALHDALNKCSLAIHPGAHAYHHILSQEWFAKWL